MTRAIGVGLVVLAIAAVLGYGVWRAYTGLRRWIDRTVGL